MLTTGFQLAAARALIGMDQADLAERAGFSVTTIRNMERAGSGPIAGRAANVHAVQQALEAEGIVFTNGGEPGVRVVQRHPFRHDATHLHALWDREGSAIDVDGHLENARVEKIPEGLVCRGVDGRELGRVSVVDGKVTVAPMPSPPFPAKPLKIDRLLPTELRAWIRVATKASRDGPKV